MCIQLVMLQHPMNTALTVTSHQCGYSATNHYTYEHDTTLLQHKTCKPDDIQRSFKDFALLPRLEYVKKQKNMQQTGCLLFSCSLL